MRVLVYSDTSGIGGAERTNHLIACGLAQGGLVVCFAQAPAEHELVQQRAALHIRQLWLTPDTIYDSTRLPAAFTDRDEPRRIFAESAPDLVFFADGSPVSSLAAKQVAAEQGLPFVCLVHLVDPRWTALFAPQVAQLADLYQAARKVVAVSRTSLALLHAHFGLPADKGQVILCAPPDPFFAPRDPVARLALREELGIPTGAILCLTTARVELSKGGQYLLEAARRLRGESVWAHLHFLWAGEGTRLSQLATLARLLRLDDHFRFLGLRTDIPQLLDAADLFILPSEIEGMPMAVMEAMAKGLPVLTTAVGGTPEALDDAGLLLPDPTRDKHAMILALSDAIRRCAVDPELRRALGAAAKGRAERLFRQARVVAEFLALVQSCR